MLAASTGIVAPGAPTEPPPKPERRVLLHRAALRPGAVLFLGLLGYTGFLAFAALAEEVGIANTGTVFTVLRWSSSSSDLRGETAGPTGRSDKPYFVVVEPWALPYSPCGPSPWAFTWALRSCRCAVVLFPALFALVVDDAPDAERSHAISTLSMFFDLAFGLGGPVIGLVSDTFDRSTAFAVSAGIATFALACGRIMAISPHRSGLQIGPRSRR